MVDRELVHPLNGRFRLRAQSVICRSRQIPSNEANFLSQKLSSTRATARGVFQLTLVDAYVLHTGVAHCGPHQSRLKLCHTHTVVCPYVYEHAPMLSVPRGRRRTRAAAHPALTAL